MFKSATGITDNTLIRFFIGSSNSAQNSLTDKGSDLLGGSDLYGMATDYVSPFGIIPSGVSYYDGSIRFVEDLAGFGDVAVVGPNDTLYLRVDDLDLNSATNPSGTVRVELTTPSGDVEVVILSATGVNGKYTGMIPTSAGGISTRDGTLQLVPDETITATYIDAIPASISPQSIPRTDTVLATARPGYSHQQIRRHSRTGRRGYRPGRVVPPRPTRPLSPHRPRPTPMLPTTARVPPSMSAAPTCASPRRHPRSTRRRGVA